MNAIQTVALAVIVLGPAVFHAIQAAFDDDRAPSGLKAQETHERWRAEWAADTKKRKERYAEKGKARQERYAAEAEERRQERRRDMEWERRRRQWQTDSGNWNGDW